MAKLNQILVSVEDKQGKIFGFFFAPGDKVAVEEKIGFEFSLGTSDTYAAIKKLRTALEPFGTLRPESFTYSKGGSLFCVDESIKGTIQLELDVPGSDDDEYHWEQLPKKLQQCDCIKSIKLAKSVAYGYEIKLKPAAARDRLKTYLRIIDLFAS